MSQRNYSFISRIYDVKHSGLKSQQKEVWFKMRNKTVYENFPDFSIQISLGEFHHKAC